MVTQAVPKTVIDVARELANLLVRFPLESQKVQDKIDELTSVAREQGQLPPYGTGLAAAKDALGQTLGVFLGNISRDERRALEGQFERTFAEEFRRLAPHIKIH
ncbi:MAG: hypothetical protein Q7R55_00045 [Candidatus Wildermuthbacteria bacterium]|nr:hypothetical protein [Candidatus Wildermuthbacteria bacterium]